MKTLKRIANWLRVVLSNSEAHIKVGNVWYTESDYRKTFLDPKTQEASR